MVACKSTVGPEGGREEEKWWEGNHLSAQLSSLQLAKAQHPILSLHWISFDSGCMKRSSWPGAR